MRYLTLAVQCTYLHPVKNNYFKNISLLVMELDYPLFLVLLSLSVAQILTVTTPTNPWPGETAASRSSRSVRANARGIYKGGSLTVAGINSTAIRLNSLIAWDLDNGLCERGCRAGMSTRALRSQLISQTGDPGIFGRWYLETVSNSSNYKQLDITDSFNRNSQFRVLEINAADGWVLEQAQVDLLPIFTILT